MTQFADSWRVMIDEREKLICQLNSESPEQAYRRGYNDGLARAISLLNTAQEMEEHHAG